MKIINFRGDLTDNSAKKETLSFNTIEVFFIVSSDTMILSQDFLKIKINDFPRDASNISAEAYNNTSDVFQRTHQ